MTRGRTLTKTAPIPAEPADAGWIVTTHINASRTFAPGNAITPADLSEEAWEGLVKKGRIVRPSPPEAPRKTTPYRVVASELSIPGQRWWQGAIIEEGELDPLSFKAALDAGQIEAAGDPIPKRVPQTKAECDRLFSQLDAGQRAALKRAYSGAAPVIVGSPADENNQAGMLASIEMIEGAAKAMLRASPSGEWPYWREELPRLLGLVTDWRTARAAGHADTAGLLTMSIGAMFTRLAFLLFAGVGMARAAATRLALPKTQDRRRRNLEEYEIAWKAEAIRLDAEHRGERKSAANRADRIRNKLTAWMIKEGHLEEGEEGPKVSTIRKILPAVK